MRILRYVTGLGGWGMLTFMLTCVTCTSYVTSLGWRWMNSKMKSLNYGGHRSSLERPCSSVSWKKTRRVFRNKFPVIYRLSFKKPLQSPGEFWANFGAWISSFAMAKTTFFKKNIKTLARFSPRRDIYIYIHVTIQVTYTYTYKPCTMPHVIVCFSISAWSACFLLYDHLWSDISLWWHLFTFLVTCLKSALGGRAPWCAFSLLY